MYCSVGNLPLGVTAGLRCGEVKGTQSLALLHMWSEDSKRGCITLILVHTQIKCLCRSVQDGRGGLTFRNGLAGQNTMFNLVQLRDAIQLNIANISKFAGTCSEDFIDSAQV